MEKPASDAEMQTPSRNPEKLPISVRRAKHDSLTIKIEGDDDFTSPPRTGPLLTNISVGGEDQHGTAKFLFWVIVNCLATIGIVFLNRAVLTHEHFRGAPTLFVAFHFLLTSMTMWLLSTDRVGVFVRRPIPWKPVLPICVVFGISTIVTNASLAMLEVPTYQLMRVLLTPATVIVNLVAYRTTISSQASLCLTIVCLGVAVMTLADTASKATVAGTKNTILGYACGAIGVVLSAVYAIWIGRYHKRFEATSMQLLYVVAPLSTAILWAASPFLDELPKWRDVRLQEWMLVFGAGLMACMINVSQYCIVARSSAVASTVVGHLKTCMIVAIGWHMAHTEITPGCGVGIVSALFGIFAYSFFTVRENNRKVALVMSPTFSPSSIRSPVTTRG